MKVVGIDLSGPRNIADTCLVSFEERGDELHFVEVREGADDDQLLKAITGLSQTERIVIGIDAPLSYNSKGGDRPSDSELRRLIRERGGKVGVMPPTLNRMVYLTLRGIVLTHLLESLQYRSLEIVEIHPGACMFLREAKAEDVHNFKHDYVARVHLLDWLGTKGLKDLSSEEPISDHYVAACAAALGGWQWSRGQAVWCYKSNPPWHPYDFGC